MDKSSRWGKGSTCDAFRNVIAIIEIVTSTFFKNVSACVHILRDILGGGGERKDGRLVCLEVRGRGAFPGRRISRLQQAQHADEAEEPQDPSEGPSVRFALQRPLQEVGQRWRRWCERWMCARWVG